MRRRGAHPERLCVAGRVGAPGRQRLPASDAAHSRDIPSKGTTVTPIPAAIARSAGSNRPSTQSRVAGRGEQEGVVGRLGLVLDEGDGNVREFSSITRADPGSARYTLAPSRGSPGTSPHRRAPAPPGDAPTDPGRRCPSPRGCRGDAGQDGRQRSVEPCVGACAQYRTHHRRHEYGEGDQVRGAIHGTSRSILVSGSPLPTAIVLLLEVSAVLPAQKT